MLGPAFRLLKGHRSNYAELEYDFKECYKALSEKLDWENPKGDDYPFDLSKPLPLIKREKHQRVPFEFFINNDLKCLQGGISTMTYTTSTTKTKAAKYDLPGIEDMVPNIWSPVKVAYDRYALWGISHWRQQRKSFNAYARGKQSREDVYTTKRILAVTHVKVMRKHRYGYLEKIVVRRADNVLYRFKEGDFPRLRINDIKDMLVLVVQNRLTNLSGDDVAYFAITLRMFTRSLVIQKRVEDLQLGVESYQKKINVTKSDTTRPDLKKRHPYTPYKDPQGFIYVDDYQRNRHNQEYRHGVLAEEKMEQFAKEKISFHDQGHQQAAKGKEDDEELGEIRWFDTSARNPVKIFFLKLNLPDPKSISAYSKEYVKKCVDTESKVSFHQALNLILELDEAAIGCTWDILRQSDCLDRLSEISLVVPTFVVIEGEAEMKAIQDVIAAKTIPPKTYREILDEVLKSTNHAYIAGVGRQLAGEQLEDLKRQHALEKEEQRKAFESQQNSLKKFVDFFNRQQGTPFSQFQIPDLYTPQVFPNSISTPGGPSSTSPAPSSTPLGLGTFDPETSQSGEQEDDNGSDDGNGEYDVDREYDA
ncbi:hypothetical protein Tco_0691949, partial [Tanacetum coccineum]